MTGAIMNKRSTLFLMLSACIASGAWAQETSQPASTVTTQAETAEAEVDPEFASDRGAPVYLGSVKVYAAMGIGFGSDDNIRAVPDSQPKVSGNYWLYSPSVWADYEAAGQRYAFTYAGSLRRYNDSSKGDIDSHGLSLSGDNTFTARNRLGWQVSHKRAEEDYDSDLTREADEPVQYRLTSVAATYRYGAEGARGRLEFDVGHSEKRYLNRSDITADSDADISNWGIRFLTRLMPKTFAFIEWQEAETDYKSAGSNRDSTQESANLGLTWRATAKTNGALRVGKTRRNYDDPSRADYRGTTWRLTANWAPMTYSRFSLTAGREVGDSTTVFGFGAKEVDSYGVSWNHAWKSYLRTTLSWAREEADYRSSNRTDKTDRFLAGIYYSFPRNYSLGLEFLPSKRESSLNEFDYDRKRYMAVFKANF
jgi:polysaccharide biosynthesis protein VpsM